MAKVSIGDLVTVVWSNGAGESVYRVVENLVGPATFELVSESEYGSGVDEFGDDWVMPDGYEFVPNSAEADDDGMDDEDVKAVMRDIQTRRSTLNWSLSCAKLSVNF